ncbi:MAG TPA: flagellin [Candidatus Baltobacteraceae bacterium]|jgi:flagellin|nr:flagellin [Candidatus Baltobacteraceae bacterium]
MEETSAMSSGLSIANNLLAIGVQLHLDANQQQLQNTVTQLSSGLRINSAADDPSGLAIATNLQTKVDGFNQAAQNVQNANNAAQVALGALTSTTQILQRIRSLAVEGASDINSNDDRLNLQTEVTQLLLEVNRISQNTNFNGQALLDGTHAGFQSEQDAFLTITANTALATNGAKAQVNGVNYGFLIASAVGVVAGGTNFFNTTPNAANPGIQGIGNGQATVDGTLELQVVNTGVSIAVQETFIQSATGYVCVSSSLFGPSAGAASRKNITANWIGNSAGGFDNVAIVLGSITTADVGTTAYIKVSQNVAALTNPNDPAFNFQSGADEGDVIQVGIQATNTSTLRISNINVAISAANNPSIGSEDAIGQIDNALQRLLNQQAQLGAVVVRLNIDQDADNVAATNLQAAESNIRDLNVGQATTQFARLQILVQVGTSVLAQSNANAQSVLTLFR